MNADQAFLQRLHLKHPIIQAPMAGVSTAALAAAVSNAGGLGSLGIGASRLEDARAMIESCQAQTTGSINVNVFCHRPARRDPLREAAWLKHLAPLFDEAGAALPDALTEIYPSFVGHRAATEMLLQTRPAVVSFHFGLPETAQIEALRAAGIFTMASATHPAEAEAIEAAGVDAIVAQGIEAGGHRGIFDPDAEDALLSTAVLLRLLVRRHRRPVIASGGIMDGAAIRAMLDLGAAAVQMGTAFVLCPESAADADYRAALRSERADQTRLSPALSGRPARGLLNRLMRHAEARNAPPPADYPLAYDATKRLLAAASPSLRTELAPYWAGQGAPLARTMPAAALIGTLVAEAGLPG